MAYRKLEAWQNPKAKPFIQLQNVSKKFDMSEAISNVSLDIYKGEFFSLLGESGCGKTTLLRLLAGFERPSSGRIFIDNIDVTEANPYDLPVNMMFQSYALFPHMNVFANVAFGLRQANVPKKELRERVFDMLDLVQMTSFAERKPHQLSGGQKQRVALARSLARQPKVLLLDEPLAALDKNHREKTQFELVNIQEKLGLTFLMVTHDQEEAMTMSTRVGIMEKGIIRQIGPPVEVYEYPNSSFVARFIGTINMFEGIVDSIEEEYIVVKSPDTDLPLFAAYTASAPVGSIVSVAVRPEKISLSSAGNKENKNTISGIVKEIAYLGDVSVYYVKVPSGKIVLATQQNMVRMADRPVTWEDKVFLSWDIENSVILAA